MKTFVRPSNKELDLLKLEATQNGTVSVEDWIKKFVISFTKLLKKDPLQYRSYGAFWWIIKKELIELGIKDFGEHIDLEFIEFLDYKDRVYNILASWAYMNSQEEIKTIHDNVHTMLYFDDDIGNEYKSMEYILIDEEMEILVWQA